MAVSCEIFLEVEKLDIFTKGSKNRILYNPQMDKFHDKNKIELLFNTPALRKLSFYLLKARSSKQRSL